MAIKRMPKNKSLLMYKFMPDSGKNRQVLIFHSFFIILGDPITFNCIPEGQVNCSDLLDVSRQL